MAVTTPGDVPAEPQLPRTPLWTRVASINVLWIVLVEVALVVAFTVIQPNFLTPFNIKSIVADQSGLIVLSVGMTFVIITAGIDLSVGQVLIFSGVVGGKVMLALGGAGATGLGAESAGLWPILAGVVAAMVAGTAVGLLNGFLVAKAHIPPLIVTLGTYGMALGASYLLTGGTDLRGIPTALSDTLGFGALFDTVPYLVLVAAGIVVAAGLLLAYTRFGRYTYAIGSNQEAAHRVGVDVDRHLIAVYMLMGFLAGVAGVMNLAHFTTTTIAGHTGDNLAAIAAVVIGGTSLFGGRGSIAGTVVGVLIPATLASGFVIIGVNPYWQYVAVGIVLVGAVYVDQLRRRARRQA